MTRIGLFCALLLSFQPDPDAVPWSPIRRLKWDDFKAEAPFTRQAGALSALNFSYSIGCRDGRLQGDISTMFLPRQSWVSFRVATSSFTTRAALEHEQTHFDLAEVHARKARKLISELADACAKTDDELMALAEGVFREDAAAQQRYDRQTSHGQDRERQTHWDLDVARQLVALKSWASPSLGK